MKMEFPQFRPIVLLQVRYGFSVAGFCYYVFMADTVHPPKNSYKIEYVDRVGQFDGLTDNPISITGAKMILINHLLKNGYELNELV